ncbi:uncharacterized protein LOC111731293 isoform X3 [Pteropus vampyrus]|uniref:Uncharacterized protein LOC111731293 isoform X3 n=1 Tax=Pteropus vampyrus TaxID=132908 RepID=A0A6P6BUM9_PTEVA|nr:uncharacterized protein LOC111731293 isoform X3 [Pteropus vampyrus]
MMPEMKTTSRMMSMFYDFPQGHNGDVEGKLSGSRCHGPCDGCAHNFGKRPAAKFETMDNLTPKRPCCDLKSWWLSEGSSMSTT